MYAKPSITRFICHWPFFCNIFSCPLGNFVFKKFWAVFKLMVKLPPHLISSWFLLDLQGTLDWWQCSASLYWSMLSLCLVPFYLIQTDRQTYRTGWRHGPIKDRAHSSLLFWLTNHYNTIQTPCNSALTHLANEGDEGGEGRLVEEYREYWAQDQTSYMHRDWWSSYHPDSSLINFIDFIDSSFTNAWQMSIKFVWEDEEPGCVTASVELQG